MSLSLQAQLKQSQSLALTPQMLQSMKVLQLSHHELEEYLQEEADKNPILEFQPRNLPSGFDFQDLNIGEKQSLQSLLFENILPRLKTAQDKTIAYALIHALDEAGYISTLPTEFDDEDVSAILTLLQENAPAGVGARDLTECLSLQLRAKNRLDPMMATLLTHLDCVAKRDYAKLKALCNCDDEDLRDMLEELKNLNPRPALAFDHAPLVAPEPDILVTPHSITLNPNVMPALRLNNAYRLQLKKGDAAFTKTLTQSANGLFRMVAQRHETLKRVAVEVFKQQDEFLAKGKVGLKPLTLKQVADELDLHESTISRTISHKTVLTPQGLFELKFFFTNSVGLEGTASEAIRSRIKSLIAEETKVLSDDDLVVLLKKEQIDLARRTVAKYREGLNIASSVLRKREKLLSKPS